MTQFFEVFSGDPKTLSLRLYALKTAGATLISYQTTSVNASFVITYTAAGLIAPAQPQT